MRVALAGLAIALLLGGPALAADWPRTVTDVFGREVEIPREPHRVLLAEGFQLLFLALLDRDPVGLLAAWGGDLKRFDAPTYELFRSRFPALAEVPVVGSGSGETFSLEASLAAEPDLALVSSWQVPAGPEDPLILQLSAAGIPVVVTDFYQRPDRHVVAGLRAMGRALGREPAAEAFIAFFAERMERLKAGMREPPPWRPRTMLHAYPGVWPCCWSAGSEGIGSYLDLLGAINIGAEQYPSANGGLLNLEFVIAQDPQVYVVTGLPGTGKPGSLEIGTGIDEATAQASLAELVQVPGIAELDAVRAGRAHGLWNFIISTPIAIAGLEALASWLQPERFAALDPAATLREINQRFLAAPLNGTYWVSVGAPPAAGGG
ncbi:MAG: ABC transporter substrate-binding protein [Geminicoccaceae bacterium]